ncbi:MAG: azurin [Pseudomonadota bacterium]
MKCTRWMKYVGVLTVAWVLSACGSGDGDEKSAVAEAAESASEMASDAVDAAGEMASDAADAAGDMASDAADAAADAVDAAGDMASDAVDAAGEMASDAADAAGEMASDAMDAAGEMASDAAEGASAMVDDAKAAVATATTAAASGDGCALAVEVGDSLAYSTKALTVPSSCDTVTVTLTHTGNLPKVAMGHNWVLAADDVADAVAAAGVSAGADGNYLAADETRYVAATKLIGGGESDTVSFSLSDLEAGKNYVYVCTFPGHTSIMRGTFTVGG